jgi:hypothetical protein
VYRKNCPETANEGPVKGRAAIEGLAEATDELGIRDFPWFGAAGCGLTWSGCED